MGGRPTLDQMTPAVRQDIVGFEPTHTSTKQVRALEIVALDDLALGYLDVRMPDGAVRQVNVPRDLARRGTPVPGDRLIIYRDGYVSWCPKAVFEGGEYRAVGVAANPAVPHLAGLAFGEALEALKAGVPHRAEDRLMVDGAEQKTGFEAATHKGLPVAGYRPQRAETVALVNENKAIEERVLRRMDALATMPPGTLDPRWYAIARTQIEQGFMALNRALFQPERAGLPEDRPPAPMAFEGPEAVTTKPAA